MATRTAVREARRSAALALAGAAVFDLSFLLGVVLPYRGHDYWSGAPMVPLVTDLTFVLVFASVFALPLVCAGIVVRAAVGAAGRGVDAVARRLYAAAVALALTGIALYVSPLGRAAIAYLLD
ncbi:hypothetical protein [Motilibacter aurantiacus]|uniref:hypothetical protein n=1 Tax=Motilibacter aurantiacus TaxID=2714955 RepID=UPI00140E8D55|nr:hypothetical protein [Motilibacter aurantiacus]NHC46071.1 hypothetical protein [Motilibacter aurantiacus]